MRLSKPRFFLSPIAGLLLLCAACPTGATTGAVGSWQGPTDKDTIVVRSDNTFEMKTKKDQTITGTWKLDGTKLTLDSSMGSNTAELKGDEIHVTFGQKTTVYKRK